MKLFKIVKAYFNDKNLFLSIKNIFGFYHENILLYKHARRHKSVAQEFKKGVDNSNERLEYLGDAILNSVVADFLFKKFPYKNEGFLTQMRSKIVSRNQLNDLSKKTGLDKFIQSDKGLNNHCNSIKGNAFEAFIGALYIDKGYNISKKIIINHIIKHNLDIDELKKTEYNFKSKIIEWCQKNKKTISFNVVDTTGNGYNKKYIVEVLINNIVSGRGQDFSIKKAEQDAAENACNNKNIK